MRAEGIGEPSLADQRVFQRSGIAFGLGLLVGAGTPVLIAVSAPAIVVVGTAVGVGLALDFVVKPKLFDAAGAGE